MPEGWNIVLTLGCEQPISPLYWSYRSPEPGPQENMTRRCYNLRVWESLGSNSPNGFKKIVNKIDHGPFTMTPIEFEVEHMERRKI